jgi:hypothetical protein
MTNANNESKLGQRRYAKGAMRCRLFAVVLVGTGVLSATLIGNSAVGSGWKRHGGHHWGQVQSIEDAQQRARQIAAWLAGSVDASEAQTHEIEAILIELGSDLFPIREQHRTHRLQLIT